MASGKKQVIILGTSHKYQIPGNPAEDQFRSLIDRIFRKIQIEAIAEEMSVEALRLKGVDQSISNEIASSRGLSHRYCDPINAERQALQIKSESLIRSDGSYFVIRSDGSYFDWADDGIEQEVRASHSIRERYWLRQLIEFDCWPVLFICGANHVEPFSRLLRDNRVSVTIAVRDWEFPYSKARVPHLQ